MAVTKKAPPKKTKPATIQLVDPELKAELDRVAAFVGEDAPALLRRIIRRGLLVEVAARTVYKPDEEMRVAVKVQADHAHVMAFLARTLGQPQQQPVMKPSAASEGEITFDNSGFGDSQDV